MRIGVKRQHPHSCALPELEDIQRRTGVRIGLVVPGFSADAEDWCIPALRHLVVLLAATDEVRVLALRYPSRAERYSLFGAEVVALGGANGRGWRSARVWRRALAQLIAEHRRRPFDLLHAFWANETGALVALAGRLLRIPTIVSLAGGELVGFRDIGYGGQLALAERARVRVALGLATAVTAGSRTLEERSIPWLGSRRAESLHRVPLGIDLAMFRPPTSVPTDGLLRLIHVASLVPIKDQRTLLLAAAHLRDAGLPFLLDMIGHGPLEGELRALADRLGLREEVRFLGELPHDRLPAIYATGSVFLLTSRHEAQGMAVLEAAACGIPTVGTGVGVVPELAPEAAIAVSVGDHHALAEAVSRLGRDSARRSRMGEAARRMVEAEFSLEMCVERLRRLYSTLS